MVYNMLYNMCYITFPKWVYNIQIWLYNSRDGYITHPHLPDADAPPRHGAGHVTGRLGVMVVLLAKFQASGCPLAGPTAVSGLARDRAGRPS